MESLYGKEAAGLKTVRVSAAENITVRAGRVFDGRVMIPGGNMEIVVASGKILDVCPASREKPPDSGCDGIYLDLRECTVMPGLVDCHVHLALDGCDFSRSLELWAQRPLLEERIGADLRRTLSLGIVAVRDGGDREGIGLMTRDLAARGDMPGPLIRAAGMALGRQGMYGSFLGPGIREEPVRNAVKRLSGLGVDQVKVLVSGVVSFKSYGRVGSLQFGEKELGEIVSEAHSREIRVMAHASSDDAVRMAVGAGVDSLEHGYFISRQSLEDLAGAGIPWVPTLAPVASQAKGPMRERYSPGEREIIEKTLRRQMTMVKLAAEVGVTIGVGSDAGAAGVPHGEGCLEEIFLIGEAGLSGVEVLRAATSSGASILGLEKELGAVRPGLPPYLIAVRGNPAEDLGCLRNIELMILPSRG